MKTPSSMPVTWRSYCDNLDNDQKDALLATMYQALELIYKPNCVMSYGVPTIKYNDNYIIAAGAYKQFLSIYPFGNEAIVANAELFANNKKSKGAVRFSYEQLPTYQQIKAVVNYNLKNPNA